MGAGRPLAEADPCAGDAGAQLRLTRRRTRAGGRTAATGRDRTRGDDTGIRETRDEFLALIARYDQLAACAAVFTPATRTTPNWPGSTRRLRNWTGCGRDEGGAGRRGVGQRVRSRRIGEENRGRTATGIPRHLTITAREAGQDSDHLARLCSLAAFAASCRHGCSNRRPTENCHDRCERRAGRTPGIFSNACRDVANARSGHFSDADVTDVAK